MTKAQNNLTQVLEEIIDSQLLPGGSDPTTAQDYQPNAAEPKDAAYNLQDNDEDKDKYGAGSQGAGGGGFN